MKRTILLEGRNHYRAIMIVKDNMEISDDFYGDILMNSTIKEFEAIARRDIRIDFYSTKSADIEIWAV